MSTPDVTVVRACLRGDTGGSPTAVVLEDDGHGPLPGDGERHRIPVARGTSHTVDVRHVGDSTELRFFTAEGRLPTRVHGTAATRAFPTARHGGAGPYRATLRAGRRVFAARAERDGELITAAFGPGPVDLREPTAQERALVLPALGLAPDEASGSPAGPDRAALAALRPDPDRLRAAGDRFGAYVQSKPLAPPAPSRPGSSPLPPPSPRRRKRTYRVELGGTARVLTEQNQQTS